MDQANQWLEEADRRSRLLWSTTPSGLPIIKVWSQLHGVESLPSQIVWEKDGKEMVLIPPGPFIMGTTEKEAREIAKQWGLEDRWTLAETPQREVTLAAYYMDVTPVTHAEYARFLTDNPQHRIPYVDKPWAQPYNWTRETRQPPEGLDRHPVVLVSWDDAQAYAQWSGKVLPTEAQWEKGARGTDGRRYPWGDRWDRALLNSAERSAGRDFENGSDWDAWRQKTDTAKQAYTTPAGAYPAGVSPFGLLDMAGNVWERVVGWYQAYPGSQAENEDFDENYRVVRGGSWFDGEDFVRASFRLWYDPSIRSGIVGFRCASILF